MTHLLFRYPKELRPPDPGSYVDLSKRPEEMSNFQYPTGTQFCLGFFFFVDFLT